MNTPRETLIDWLRDAYAMERGLENTLEKHAENEEFHPALRAQAAMHLIETRRHAADVQSCLESLGSDTSTLKVAIAKVTETIKGLGTALASDERVKDILAAYATEHFEIACYRALRAGAAHLGETGIVAMCDRILPDEEKMASWLEENLPDVVTSYLIEEEAETEK
jgi:ferritin-like metal-binding protein YciE